MGGLSGSSLSAKLRLRIMKENHLEGPTAIIIYGMIAVGKLTVAKALQEKLGYRLTHNHLINDLVWSLFDHGTLEANSLIERLRYELYEEAIKKGVCIIVTHAYSASYVSPTGLSDPEYMRVLESKLEAAGAKILFVHLQADTPILLKRVQEESRRAYKKLTDVSKLNEYLYKENLDTTTSAPVRNNLVIENAEVTPASAADMIIKRLHEQP
jgi:deoxyadenosine/deoxycytidine kinase